MREAYECSVIVSDEIDGDGGRAGRKARHVDPSPGENDLGVWLKVEYCPRAVRPSGMVIRKIPPGWGSSSASEPCQVIQSAEVVR